MTMRLLESLSAHARYRGSSVAARSVGAMVANAITYCALDASVLRLAGVLGQAAGPGSTVVLSYPNRPEYLAGYLGVLAAGSTVFPMSSDSVGPELLSAAERSGAAAAIVPADTDSPLRAAFKTTRALPELSENVLLLTGPAWTPSHRPGPAMLLQSSGTTSRPKIVRRDAASLDAVSSAMVNACGFTPEDHVLAAVPLCHSYGVEHGLLAPIMAGSCVHICEKFDLPAVLVELREAGITLLPGVPFMFEMLNRAVHAPFPMLRKVYSAGGPLPRATFDAFQQKCGLRIGQVYGATEIGSVTFNAPDRDPFDPASVGIPMEGVSILILDAEDPRIDQPLSAGAEGQVAIAAESMLSEYLDGETPPLIDGHYLTGDLGTLNAQGALTITGRLKLLIDIGGRKVNPAEVEAVLRQHPAVGACVVLPMRLSETVCRLKAIVTPARPGMELPAQDLRRFARERLSGYKVPRIFEVREALPTSASGKVLRRLVESQ